MTNLAALLDVMRTHPTPFLAGLIVCAIVAGLAFVGDRDDHDTVLPYLRDER